MESEAQSYETLIDTPRALVSLLVEKDQLLTEKDFEINKLQNALINARRHLFGKKSEKLPGDDGQLKIFTVEEPETDSVKTITIPSHERTANKKRKPIPAELPRERVEYQPEESCCSSCGAELVRIGEEKTEILEKIPAQFFVKEHVKIKKACSKCKEAGVFIGKIPAGEQVLERCKAGASLLSHIIVSKYQDHLPLHRQEQMYLRSGVHIPRQRMCDWIGGAVDLLMPIYDAHVKLTLSQDYLHADETTADIQQPLENKTGYAWGVLAPLIKAVFFRFADTRASEIPEEIFKGYKGTVLTDAYAGYNPVFLPEGVTRLGCFAHVRRRFIESQEFDKPACNKVLMLIAELYKVEKENKSLEPLELKKIREKKSKPVLDKLKEYLVYLQTSKLPKNPIKESADYALNQWEELSGFLKDGRYSLDNNAIEREMRPIAIGRKNWLFVGSVHGGQRAAVLFSLLGTCKLHKINPILYLTDVLKKVHMPGIKVESLIPTNWKKINSS